jgi:hypothetical protein
LISKVAVSARQLGTPSSGDDEEVDRAALDVEVLVVEVRDIAHTSPSAPPPPRCVLASVFVYEFVSVYVSGHGHVHDRA